MLVHLLLQTVNHSLPNFPWRASRPPNVPQFICSLSQSQREARPKDDDK